MAHCTFLVCVYYTLLIVIIICIMFVKLRKCWRMLQSAVSLCTQKLSIIIIILNVIYGAHSEIRVKGRVLLAFAKSQSTSKTQWTHVEDKGKCRNTGKCKHSENPLFTETLIRLNKSHLRHHFLKMNSAADDILVNPILVNCRTW